MSRKSKLRAQVFRQARAKELCEFAEILTGIQIDNSKVLAAAAQCKSEQGVLSHDKSTNESYWGYNIRDMIIRIPPTSAAKPPQKWRSAELKFSMDFVADLNHWDQDDLHDPILELNLSVSVRAIGDAEHHFSFHIDKHTGEETKEAHPLYHVQFPICPRGLKDTFKYGDALGLEVPRLTHHPVDLILGLSILLSNFSVVHYQKLIRASMFKRLHGDYQKAILLPYFNRVVSDLARSGTSRQNYQELIPTIT